MNIFQTLDLVVDRELQAARVAVESSFVAEETTNIFESSTAPSVYQAQKMFRGDDDDFQ